MSMSVQSGLTVPVKCVITSQVGLRQQVIMYYCSLQKCRTIKRNLRFQMYDDDLCLIQSVKAVCVVVIISDLKPAKLGSSGAPHQ